MGKSNRCYSERRCTAYFPYHKYNPVIDLLREAAMDPDVKSIQITLIVWQAAQNHQCTDLCSQKR
jgi:polyphosphate kinase